MERLSRTDSVAAALLRAAVDPSGSDRHPRQSGQPADEQRAGLLLSVAHAVAIVLERLLHAERSGGVPLQGARIWGLLTPYSAICGPATCVRVCWAPTR